MSKTERIDDLDADVSALEGRIDDFEERIDLNEQQITSNDKLTELLERVNKQHRDFIIGLSGIIVRLLQKGNITAEEKTEIIDLLNKLSEVATTEEE